MTSSDTPDTGAGAPLTAEEHLYGCAGAHGLDCPCKCHVRAHRERLITALVFAGADERPATEHEAERWLDAARLATDPAGLDAFHYVPTWRAWEQFADVATKRGSGPTRDQTTGAAMMLGWLIDTYLPARLSVADGPGPEERP